MISDVVDDIIEWEESKHSCPRPVSPWSDPWLLHHQIPPHTTPHQSQHLLHTRILVHKIVQLQTVRSTIIDYSSPLKTFSLVFIETEQYVHNKHSSVIDAPKSLEKKFKKAKKAKLLLMLLDRITHQELQMRLNAAILHISAVILEAPSELKNHLYHGPSF